MDPQPTQAEASRRSSASLATVAGEEILDKVFDMMDMDMAGKASPNSRLPCAISHRCTCMTSLISAFEGPSLCDTCCLLCAAVC